MVETGRHPQEERPASGRKDKVAHVRFSASEWQAIDAAAVAAGMTLSGFMRALSIEGAGVRPFLTDDEREIFAVLATDLRALGVNLNQLARRANASGRFSSDAVDPTLMDLQKLVAALAIEFRDLGRRGGQRHRGA